MTHIIKPEDLLTEEGLLVGIPKIIYEDDNVVICSLYQTEYLLRLFDVEDKFILNGVSLQIYQTFSYVESFDEEDIIKCYKEQRPIFEGLIGGLGREDRPLFMIFVFNKEKNEYFRLKV